MPDRAHLPNDRNGPTAFVTGGTGFVGSHLVEALLARGYSEVRCLVRSRLKWLEGLDVVVVKGDMDDLDALRIGCEGVDYVFHVAAVTGTKAKTTEAEFRAANVTATERLLEIVEAVAPRVRKVVVTSSLAAVGLCEGGVADESTPLRPVSGYGRSKAEMESIVAKWFDRLPIVIVRPPAVYGPREEDIYTFFKTLNGGLCPIVGRGLEPEINLVFGSDLVRGMVQAAESESTSGNVYFLGSNEDVSWRRVRDAAREALGRRVFTLTIPESLVEPVGAFVEGVGRIAGRHTPLDREKAREIRFACKRCRSDRARADFGYEARVSIEEGIRETIAWYRSAGWL